MSNPLTFDLSEGQNLHLFIADSRWKDNGGGVSLELHRMELFEFTIRIYSADIDNNFFSITRDELRLAQSLDFESKEKYSIRVKGTDSEGLSIEKSFVISATNIPEAPTAISLDNNTVEENLKKGATVGRLSTTDEDSREKHTYKLVDAPEGETNQNDRFTISGSTLRTNDVFDFDAVQEQTVHVEVTDRGKLTLFKHLRFRLWTPMIHQLAFTGTDQRG